jgi:hypothetical protein
MSAATTAATATVPSSAVAAAKATLLDLNAKRTVLEAKIGALKEQAKVNHDITIPLFQ